MTIFFIRDIIHIMKIFYLLILIIYSSLAVAQKSEIDDNLRLAKEISQLLTQKNINIRQYDWDRLARETQINIYFNDFTWWFDTLGQIKRDPNFTKNCTKFFYTEAYNPLKELLTKHIRKHCISVFLENKNNLQSEDFDFILDNHTYFFSNNNFLKEFKKHYKKMNDLSKKEIYQNVFKIYIEDTNSTELLSFVEDTQFKKDFINKIRQDTQLKKKLSLEKRKLKTLFRNLKKSRDAFNKYIVNYELLKFKDYREAVYRIVHFYIRNKNKDKSIEILNKIIKDQYADSELAFLYLWWGVRFSEEELVLNNFELTDQFKKDPKTLFWYAQNLQNLQKIGDATKIYNQIITDYTVNYYSIMANKKLKQINPKVDVLKNFVLQKKHVYETYTLKPDVSARLDRLSFWMKIKAKSILELDIRSLQHKPNKELYNEISATKHEDKHQINLMIAEKLHENEYSLMAFRFFFDLFNTQDVTILDLQGLHPIKQLEYVKKYNQTLDPLIVISLIKQESGFNNRARSHVGASGLMQIMPATARKLSGKRRNNLHNVENNIKLGTKYLDLLNKKWDGNLVFVLASYNAGEARVHDWIRNYFNGDDLIGNIEAIPFLETNNYVKLIFRNLYFYKMTQDLTAKDSEKVNYLYDIYLGF